jgi:hypothetical protein
MNSSWMPPSFYSPFTKILNLRALPYRKASDFATMLPWIGEKERSMSIRAILGIVLIVLIVVAIVQGGAEGSRQESN